MARNDITTLIDRDLRAYETPALASSLGVAIDQDDAQAVLYILGRLDGHLTNAYPGSSVVEALTRLREVACAYLDWYPVPKRAEDPEPSQTSLDP